MADEQNSLQKHNQARASAPGIKRPALVWDDSLAKAAQGYAQQLADTNTFHHSGVKGQGENLFMSSTHSTLVEGSVAWINEKPNYHGQNIPDGNFSSYGHYTQVIWPSTTHIGIGKAVASNGATYVVGRYTPPGNFTGQSAYGTLPPTHDPNPSSRDYTVQAGDTLWKISQVFHVGLDTFKAANPDVKAPDFKVSVGEVIHVPGVARGIQRMAKAPPGYVHPVSNVRDEELKEPNGVLDGETSTSHDGLRVMGEATFANESDMNGDAPIGNGLRVNGQTLHEDGFGVNGETSLSNDTITNGEEHLPFRANMKAVQSKAASGDYTVVAGDSMWLIAKKLGVSVEALEAANPQVRPPAYEIQVGQVLKRPGGGSGGSGGVHLYSGPASNFPSADKWISWEKMSAHNATVMNTTGNSAQETQWVLDAIQEWNGPSGVDRRGILAVIMQESHGKVRVNSTTSPGAGVHNTGLMQAHNGVSFNASDAHGSIRQMVKDGACGVPGPAGGDGLQQLLARYHNFFVACRGYNSGDGGIHMDNLSNGGGATSSYCSDIANRLMGVDPN